MSNSTDHVTTAEQLASMPDDGKRYELVDGLLRMMSPAGSEHGRIAAELLLQIGQYAKQHRLGRTYAAETGFLIQRDPDTVLAPDASFVSHDRLAGLTGERGYLPLAPDLIAEVVSPHDRTRDVAAKVRTWLAAGVGVVLVVDPELATVQVHRPGRRPDSFSEGHVDLHDVLPGFQLDLADVFN